MRFIGTKRFSPVANGVDVPWEEDYFHLKPEDVTKEFLAEGDYIIDEAWWHEQEYRCIHGYTVPNAIEPGGDAIRDGIDCFWNETNEPLWNEKCQMFIPVNCCYIPQYDLRIYNREVKISGRYYFYLNFWKIYSLSGKEDDDVKGLHNPRFTDMDFLFFRRVEMMFEQKLDDQEAKSRQKGFSEKAAGGILGYNYTFIRASVNIVVAGTDTDADHTMENCIRGINDLRNTQFYKVKARGGDSSELLKAKYFKSEIRKITAKDNPQAVSRYSPFFVIYEETGKWKAGLVKDTNAYVKASTKAEGKKTGYNMFIGTGGDMELGAADMEEMHYHPEKEGILSFDASDWVEPGSNVNVRTGHFTPAWWFRIHDSEGNSLRAESLADIQNEYDNTLPSKQYTFVTQNPIYNSQMFYANTAGYFGKDVIHRINLRKAYINTHKENQVVRHGYLVPIDPTDWLKGMEYKDDPEGWLHIVEEPECDERGNVYRNLYRAATDSYDQDLSTTGSLGSCTIRKGFNQYNPTGTAYKWVARVTERPGVEEGGKETFYEHTVMACIYYGYAQNLIEYSKILIIDYYIRNRFEFLLKLRPDFVTAAMVDKSNTTNKYGIDPVTKPHWLNSLRDRLKNEDEINKIDDPYILERLGKFRYDSTGKKYNCDTTITCALNIIFDMDEEAIMTYKDEEEEEKNSDKFGGYKMVNGRIVAL